MIDRYTIFSDFQDINKRYGLTGEEFTVPNYNASPSQQLPVISNQSKKEISFFYWAINRQLANNKSVSAKLLSVDTDALVSKGPLKKALAQRRCIVPANGFYLWKQYGKKRRTPHYFSHPEFEMMNLVGIWEEFDDLEGSMTFTFRIIERPNYTGIEDFDDFLPAVITKEDESKWLDDYSSETELLEILLKDDVVNGLSNHPVSPLITNSDLNSADLIKPQAQADQLGNYTLFD